MAGNDRGKIKEHLEGVHRNLDWTIHHLNQILVLIGDTHPDLFEAIKGSGDTIAQIDLLFSQIYSTI